LQVEQRRLYRMIKPPFLQIFGWRAPRKQAFALMFTSPAGSLGERFL